VSSDAPDRIAFESSLSAEALDRGCGVRAFLRTEPWLRDVKDRFDALETLRAPSEIVWLAVTFDPPETVESALKPEEHRGG
jgi:hypothetical protein